MQKKRATVHFDQVIGRRKYCTASCNCTTWSGKTCRKHILEIEWLSLGRMVILEERCCQCGDAQVITTSLTSLKTHWWFIEPVSFWRRMYDCEGVDEQSFSGGTEEARSVTMGLWQDFAYYGLLSSVKSCKWSTLTSFCHPHHRKFVIIVIHKTQCDGWPKLDHRAGYSLGGYILGCSQRLTLRFWLNYGYSFGG